VAALDSLLVRAIFQENRRPLFLIALWSGLNSSGNTAVPWPLQILCWSRDFAGKPEDHFS
jgi:hypothetical protein